MNWHLLNFDVVEYRFFSDPENAWDAFRKGLTTIRLHGAHLCRRRTARPTATGSSSAIRNQAPVGFQGFAMNRAASPTTTCVRQALAHR